MFVKISSFPYKKVIPAWIAFLFTLTVIIFRIVDNNIESWNDIVRLFLFPVFFLVFFIYLSIVPKKYDVCYNEHNLKLSKDEEVLLIPLSNVGLLEVNTSSYLNQYSAYNNCCLSFFANNNQVARVYFYSSEPGMGKDTNKFKNFIAAVKKCNPEFRYQKHNGISKTK